MCGKLQELHPYGAHNAQQQVHLYELIHISWLTSQYSCAGHVRTNMGCLVVTCQAGIWRLTVNPSSISYSPRPRVVHLNVVRVSEVKVHQEGHAPRGLQWVKPPALSLQCWGRRSIQVPELCTCP
jgi:hypothetical protein